MSDGDVRALVKIAVYPLLGGGGGKKYIDSVNRLWSSSTLTLMEEMRGSQSADL